MSQHLEAAAQRQCKNSLGDDDGTPKGDTLERQTATSKEQPASLTSHMPTTNQAGLIGGQSGQAHTYSHSAYCQQSRQSQRIGNPTREPIGSPLSSKGAIGRIILYRPHICYGPPRVLVDAFYYPDQPWQLQQQHHGEQHDRQKQHNNQRSFQKHVKDVILVQA